MSRQPVSFTLRGVDGVLYDGFVQALNCPAEEGRLGVLPGMAPAIVRLQSGALEIFEESDTEASKVMEIPAGILHITPERVVILVA